MMTVQAAISMRREMCPQLKIGAFTFRRDPTGHVVLHVDIASGLYPLRLTREQTYALAQWLRPYPEENTSAQEDQQGEYPL